MKKPPISKEKFLSIINKLRATWDIDMEIHKLGCNNSLELETSTSALGPITTELLDIMLQDTDDGDVSYFCWELDFGRDWEPGYVTEHDENGNDIDIDFSTAEKLWEYLMEKYFDGGSDEL